MSLVHWEPGYELGQLRNQMDKMFSQLSGWTIPGMMGIEARSFNVPRVEITETDKDLIVTAEISGVEPKDLLLEITEETMFISGEVVRESEVSEDKFYHSERNYGTFSRTIQLPHRIKDKEAKATYKNGLLTVRAPLAEKVQRPKASKVVISTE